MSKRAYLPIERRPDYGRSLNRVNQGHHDMPGNLSRMSGYDPV